MSVKIGVKITTEKIQHPPPINYILQATEIEPDKLVKSVAGVSEKGGDIAMTTAEKLRQKGMQKGMFL